MFSYVQKFFGYLSLGNFAISNGRKARFAAEALLLTGLLYYEQFVVSLTDTPRLLQLLTVLIASHLFANFCRFFLTTAYRRQHHIQVGDQDNFILGMDALVTLFTIVVTLASIFPIFDIPFTDFLTGLSLFAVAIVWGFHQYITNFFDGLRLMFSSDFRIGDYIKIGDNAKGIITHVSFRATRLRTDDGDVVFVPNTNILNTEVTNFSKLRYKRIVVPFTLTRNEVPSLPDFEQALRDQVLEQFAKVIKTEKMYFRIEAIRETVIDCTFEVATEQYSFAVEDEIKKRVNQYVVDLLSEPVV